MIYIIIIAIFVLLYFGISPNIVNLYFTKKGTHLGNVIKLR